MLIPTSVGGYPHPWKTPSGTWGRLWRGLLGAVSGNHSDADSPQGTGTVAAGECAAFIDLFARYHLPLIDYLYGMTRDRELATDLAQDTFERAWATAPDLAGIAQPRAWLYRIATHVALNAARHRRRFEWLPLSRVEPEAGGQVADTWALLPRVQLPQVTRDLAVSVAERDAIWTALADLPARWRAVLLLQAAAGFEVHEIATLLHLSEANVRKCHFRAKERFRALYRQLDGMGGER
ncbi:MAG TPA: RNA polymerase sigma factor [Ktedonobacterales bacterium]|nr:RNA polymerase sigma factor [Ktedonobacterales bacterium]